VLRNNYQHYGNDSDQYAPLGDVILSSPIPYDLTIKDGASHVVVIRSSPNGHNLMAGTAAKSMWESLIFCRFFLRKNRLPKMFERLQQQQEHQRIYASTILELNEAAIAATKPDGKSTRS
jgi:predicted patatin/cPLA2 family phospholipase